MNAPFELLVASAAHDSGAVPTVLLALAFAIVCAKLAAELIERLGQPAVGSPAAPWLRRASPASPSA